MKKYIIYAILTFTFISCSAIPQQAEIEYRNRLENELLKTFPNKMSIIIHPFSDLTPTDTNDAYLIQAIPDTVESMLEPLRATLAHVPFDGQPFYVSENLSNLFLTFENTNSNANSAISSNTTNTNSYFAYLTNYLVPVPIQVTQITYDITTNTNYYQIVTNTSFQLGIEVTNYVSNNIIESTTNTTTTNINEEFRNILTTTNMLLLINEEFPDLVNYLSFVPIEIRRATEEDINTYKEFIQWQKDPVAWNKAKNNERIKARREKIADRRKDLTEQIAESKTNINIKDELAKYEEQLIKEEQTKNEFPENPFEYSYHITGTFRSSQNSPTGPLESDIRIKISEIQNTGDRWWFENKKSLPPKLSQINKILASLDTNNIENFKKRKLRTPFKKGEISPRLQEAFDTVSTNTRAERPIAPQIATENKEVSLRVRAREDQIPSKILALRKNFFATIINRPYTALRVRTNPDDTLVYLNGFYIGTTPLVYPTAPIGEQRISFIKEGFSREEVLVTITPNITNSLVIDLALTDNSGKISVTSSLPNTEVYVNSQFYGKVPTVISNLTLDTDYRVEVLNPAANISSNRNSVYQTFNLTSENPEVNFYAEFKNYETQYRTPQQKALLAGTYVSWIGTLAILGGSFYTQSRANEFRSLAELNGVSTEDRSRYLMNAVNNAVVSQVLLYTSLAGVIVSSGIMGWYLYSKDVYLGFDYDPYDNEWYANLKLKFN